MVHSAFSSGSDSRRAKNQALPGRWKNVLAAGKDRHLGMWCNGSMGPNQRADSGSTPDIPIRRGYAKSRR